MYNQSSKVLFIARSLERAALKCYLLHNKEELGKSLWLCSALRKYHKLSHRIVLYSECLRLKLLTCITDEAVLVLLLLVCCEFGTWQRSVLKEFCGRHFLIVSREDCWKHQHQLCSFCFSTPWSEYGKF